MKLVLFSLLICSSIAAFASREDSRRCNGKFCASVAVESRGLTLSEPTWDDYEISADVNMADLACEAFGETYVPGSMIRTNVNTEAEIAPITIVWMEGEIMLLSSRSAKRKVISSIMCTVK